MPSLCIETKNGRKSIYVEHFEPQGTIEAKGNVTRIAITKEQASLPLGTWYKLLDTLTIPGGQG